MPKPYTFPTLFDEVKSVSITNLRKWGYLKPNRWFRNTISWSRNGQKTASIGIEVNTKAEEPHIVLDYNYGEKPVRYTVKLVSVPSNIGKGEVWYFLCPFIKKRCRVLYSVGELFLHRDACKGYMYEKQTYSQQNRDKVRLWEKLFISDNLYKELHSKHFIKTYAGRPTKRYIKLMRGIREAKRVPYTEADLLLM